MDNARPRPVALVTGASSGIGKAYARRLAEAGHDLILVGRRIELLEQLAQELASRHGIAAQGLQADLAQPRGIEAVRERVRRETIDVLVSNAGLGTDRAFEEDELERQMVLVRVHVDASVALVRECLPGMLERGQGTIILISSMAAFAPVADQPVYDGSKAFLTAFAEALHLSYRPRGVRVQCVCPGYTRTEFHARIGQEEHVRTQKGIYWMEPEEVVDYSLRRLDKERPICIPGWVNRLGARLFSILPRAVFYQYARKHTTVPTTLPPGR